VSNIGSLNPEIMCGQKIPAPTHVRLPVVLPVIAILIIVFIDNQKTWSETTLIGGVTPDDKENDKVNHRKPDL
jgi:hypothetical protein